MPGRDLIDRVRKALAERYTVVTALGRGGNACIFAATDRTGEQVAIKVLHPELAVSVAADRFLREIRYASQLHHPHIAPLLDSGETEYLLWFVMPRSTWRRLSPGTKGMAKRNICCGSSCPSCRARACARCCGASAGWPFRQPRARRARCWTRSATRMRTASPTATSSLTTSCSRPRAPCLWTWGSRAPSRPRETAA